MWAYAARYCKEQGIIPNQWYPIEPLSAAAKKLFWKLMVPSYVQLWSGPLPDSFKAVKYGTTDFQNDRQSNDGQQEDRDHEQCVENSQLAGIQCGSQDPAQQILHDRPPIHIENYVIVDQHEQDQQADGTVPLFSSSTLRQAEILRGWRPPTRRAVMTNLLGIKSISAISDQAFEDMLGVINQLLPPLDGAQQPFPQTLQKFATEVGVTHPDTQLYHVCKCGYVHQPLKRKAWEVPIPISAEQARAKRIAVENNLGCDWCTFNGTRLPVWQRDEMHTLDQASGEWQRVPNPRGVDEQRTKWTHSVHNMLLAVCWFCRPCTLAKPSNFKIEGSLEHSMPTVPVAVVSVFNTELVASGESGIYTVPDFDTYHIDYQSPSEQWRSGRAMVPVQAISCKLLHMAMLKSPKESTVQHIFIPINRSSAPMEW